MSQTIEHVREFIMHRGSMLEEVEKKAFFDKLQKIRESHFKKAIEPKKEYQNSLWSETSKIFGSKKVIYVGKDSGSSESENDEKVLHRYVNCKHGYVQTPQNVIKIEGKYDKVIKKLVVEGRKKFPNKAGYDMLINEICEYYLLTKEYVRQVLNESVESTPVVVTSSEVPDTCSKNCYKIFKGENGGPSLSVSDETEIKFQLLSIDGDYCSIAKELNQSCNYICYLSKQIASTSYFTPKPNPKKIKMHQINNTAFNQYKKRNEQYEGLAAFYKPCNHDGKCDDSCPCFKGKNYCEIFCSCSDKCRNKFQGCVCRGKCDTKSCPCYAAVRECIAGKCGCKSNSDEGSCVNMKIQSKMHKKIDIKRSTVAGYGAFAAEDITKGDFVTEYTGELITQAEADERGKMYDESRSSYLFDLSKDFAVDGMFIGNESRFINHSELAPNCSVKTMTVLGDKRIALFAVRNIKNGEELFFNYRYNNEQKRIYFEKN